MGSIVVSHSVTVALSSRFRECQLYPPALFDVGGALVSQVAAGAALKNRNKTDLATSEEFTPSSTNLNWWDSMCTLTLYHKTTEKEYSATADSAYLISKTEQLTKYQHIRIL